mmetsp:Transcript_34473/g.80589  ORF Transcript_34473/g.80589 Transcript_34473/m.80589 type:complete len:215 (+) Transcript_34473:119-763(+)
MRSRGGTQETVDSIVRELQNLPSSSSFAHERHCCLEPRRPPKVFHVWDRVFLKGLCSHSNPAVVVVKGDSQVRHASACPSPYNGDASDAGQGVVGVGVLVLVKSVASASKHKPYPKTQFCARRSSNRPATKTTTHPSESSPNSKSPGKSHLVVHEVSGLVFSLESLGFDERFTGFIDFQHEVRVAPQLLCRKLQCTCVLCSGCQHDLPVSLQFI